MVTIGEARILRHLAHEGEMPPTFTPTPYAAVVVDLGDGGPGRVFHYSIPHELRPSVAPGVRAVVPFAGREVVGFVVGYVERPAVATLRPIKRVLEPGEAVAPHLVLLAAWLSGRYLCHPLEALSCVIPPGSRHRLRKRVVLLDDTAADRLPARASLQRRVIDLLRQRGSMELATLKLLLGKGVIDCVTRLEEREIVRVENSLSPRTRPKKVAFVVPTVDRRALAEAARELKDKAPRQAEALELLAQKGSVPRSLLVTKSGIGSASLQSLVDRGLVSVEERVLSRDPLLDVGPRDRPPLLTVEQERAAEPIIAAVKAARHEVFLLHGVTASGKTEVYMRAAEVALRAGKQVLYLVPEIALASQTVDRLRARFGGAVALLHSALAAGERYDQWRKVREGHLSIVIGARSAVFAPCEQLGLIIIDEEHENTFKQEEAPRYDARHVALKRGEMSGAPVVLGSATPSVESYYRARTGEYTLLELSRRFPQAEVPEIMVVDMRRELKEGNRSVFSRALQRELKGCLSRGEQAILFLNRRGHSTFVLCRECGHTMRCPDCDVSLTYHSGSQLLKCHYCDYCRPVPLTCPSCGGRAIRYFGSGTQKVEEALRELLPEARVMRMDVDTTRRKGAHRRILRAFARGEVDVLIGTQMVAKGLDVKGVTTVGVISADTSLNLPDFRAAERTFQLLLQVAGRAGRGDRSGRVVVQTYNPQHYSVVSAQRQDYPGFYEREIKEREAFGYPPFCEMVLVRVEGHEARRVEEASAALARELVALAGRGVRILGPAPSPIPRLRGRFRNQLLLKVPRLEPTLEELGEALRDFRRAAGDGLRIVVDVSPQSLL